MEFKRPGNSRDDRSSGAPKRSSNGAGPAKKSTNSRYGKSSSSEGGPQGDRPKRNYNDREGGGEKKSFSQRPKPYSGRPDADDRPQKSYSDREGSSDGRKSFAPKRKPYSGRPDTGDRSPRSFDKDSTGERKSYP